MMELALTIFTGQLTAPLCHITIEERTSVHFPVFIPLDNKSKLNPKKTEECEKIKYNRKKS
jgi:hypothetical protein